jgi:hypothetical protein
MGRFAIDDGLGRSSFKSECTEYDRADKHEDGAHGERIKSQGQVHLWCLPLVKDGRS